MTRSGPPTGMHLWKIRAHDHRCSLTGKPFEEGDVIYSRLRNTDDPEVFEREDFCERAWEEACLRPGSYSFWRSVYHRRLAADPSAGHSIWPSDAEARLFRLLEENDPSTETTRFFLALNLERKRILRRLGSEMRADRVVLLYEHLASGEIYLIPDPQLSLQQMSHLHENVRIALEEALAPGQNESAPLPGKAGDQATASA